MYQVPKKDEQTFVIHGVYSQRIVKESIMQCGKGICAPAHFKEEA